MAAKNFPSNPEQRFDHCPECGCKLDLPPPSITKTLPALGRIAMSVTERIAAAKSRNGRKSSYLEFDDNTLTGVSDEAQKMLEDFYVDDAELPPDGVSITYSLHTKLPSE